MSFYARRPGRLASQLVGDAFVAVWAIGWWFGSRFVDGTIRAIAEPARQTQRITSDLARQTTEAAAQAAGVPVVGAQLRQPFDGIAGRIGDLSASASDQVAQVERVATVLGWLAFLVPVLLVALWWVPRRLAFVARSRELAQLAASPEGNELLALRALANQPLGSLRQVASDPVAAWRTGDAAVMTRLADLELASAGLGRPRRSRH